MLKQLSSVAIAAIVACVPASVSARNANVNFAVGGATTNSANAMDAFAVQDPSLAQLLLGIRAAGLDVNGLEQQLDFATATLNDVDACSDVFWVYAGINNYLAGEQDPTVAPAELGAALERLYWELGARRFLVPNLPGIGDIPLFVAQPAPVKEAYNKLTVEHNQSLEGVLTQFAATHPDALVVPVDVFSVFQAHKVSGQFAQGALGCDMVLPAEARTETGACDGFLYLDIVHPASAAWAPVARAAADALAGEYVERIITVGDSFSDLGSLSDTFVRTLGFPFPLPPFTEGRFTEADNVVQQLEAVLGTGVQSSYFAQPYATTETITEEGASAVAGSVFVPKQLRGEVEPVRHGRHRKAPVELTFDNGGSKPVKCKYEYGGDGVFTLERCNRHTKGGDLVTTAQTEVKSSKRVKSVTIDWLSYR